MFLPCGYMYYTLLFCRRFRYTHLTSDHKQIVDNKYIGLSSRAYFKNFIFVFNFNIGFYYRAYFLKFFVGPRSISQGHWYPLFRISDDTAHRFENQGGLIFAYALLSLTHDNPQSHLWLLGPGPFQKIVTNYISNMDSVTL